MTVFVARVRISQSGRLYDTSSQPGHNNADRHCCNDVQQGSSSVPSLQHPDRSPIRKDPKTFTRNVATFPDIFNAAHSSVTPYLSMLPAAPPRPRNTLPRSRGSRSAETAGLHFSAAQYSLTE